MNLLRHFAQRLEEVIEADLLLHVVDYSNPNYKNKSKSQPIRCNKLVQAILVIYVYNKSELTDVNIPTAQEDRIYLSAKIELES